MKKLIKITSGVALMFVLVLTLSSFSSNTEVEAEDNNGTIVEVVKGSTWYWLTGCADPVPTTKTTSQYKNGVLHMRTLVFQLPDGHCSIPEKNASKFDLGDYRVVITPGGTMIAKQVNN